MATHAQDVQANHTQTIQKLEQILGPDGLTLEEGARTLLSTDLSWRPSAVADIVIAPSSTEELGRAVAVASEAGLAIVPRGGGMSYTSGYTPQSEQSVLVDMRRMNKIVEINTDDMYVTVEAGCTWKELYEA
ncbi:MAG: FAD-binding oxidoreductase, partial [Pseudomonadota bacterium]